MLARAGQREKFEIAGFNLSLSPASPGVIDTGKSATIILQA
jgi:hypothetical protein